MFNVNNFLALKIIQHTKTCKPLEKIFSPKKQRSYECSVVFSAQKEIQL